MSIEKASHFFRAQSGSPAVEFAIIAPLLGLLFAGLVEIGLALRTKTLLGDAVAAGVNVISLKGENTAAITTAITTATGRTDVGVSISAPYCGCPVGTSVVAATCIAICADGFASRKYLDVTATLTRPSVFPTQFLGLSGLLSAKATGLVPP